MYKDLKEINSRWGVNKETGTFSIMELGEWSNPPEKFDYHVVSDQFFDWSDLGQ